MTQPDRQTIQLPGVWHLLLRRKPDDTPMAVWTHLTETDRRAVRMMTVGVSMFMGGLLLMIGAWFFGIYGTQSTLIETLLTVGGFSAMLAAIPIVRGQRRAVRSFREFLQEHQRLVCFACGYILKGFDEEPLVCPECGRRETRSAIQQGWRRRLVGFWFKEPIGPDVI